MFRLRTKNAFTIIELIVVIAVVGILVLFAMPKLLGYVAKAEFVRIQHDTKIMQDKMEEVLSKQNTKFIEWDNNEKDLGTLIMKKQLYETAGLVNKIDKTHMKFPNHNWDMTMQSDGKGYGMGGTLIPRITEEVDGFGYKIIPNTYKTEIKTRLNGTFYSNNQGKVYYEPNKPLKGIKPEVIVLSCATAEALEYTFEYETGTIVKYLGTSQYITIPESFLVNGKCWPVRIIGAGAFSRNMPKIIEVIIPQGVEKIEEDAFEGNEIETIIIPPAVTEIGSGAFGGNNISSGGAIIQNVSDSVNIGSGAFGGVTPEYKPVTNKEIGLVIKPNVDNDGKIITSASGRPTGSITSRDNLGGSTGSNSSNNSNVASNKVIVIPDVIVVDGIEVKIVEIDTGAFQGEGLIHVTLPSGLERIEDYAFAGNQLLGISIPEKVRHIGNYAFAYNELFNGKNYEWTMNYIKLKKEEQISSVNQSVGDIEKGGQKVDNLLGSNLLAHIFLTSNSKVEIPEDYNPTIREKIKIIINPDYIDSETNIIFSYEYPDEILGQEWDLQGLITNEAPNGKLPIGNYKIRLRVLYENNEWSKWKEEKFTVNEYVEHLMNIPGNTIVENLNYDVGDNLVFNYTNSDNLNWTVPISGLYSIDMLGAGAGGKGAKVQGQINLLQGQIVNLKIYSKGNGGGDGGAGQKVGSGTGNYGYAGSAGTIIKVDTELMLAAGGAGGNGGLGRHVNGGGGPGGNGGDTTGQAGGDGRTWVSSYWGNRPGGTGGKSTSLGGNASSRGGSSGLKGKTLYDGGGGSGTESDVYTDRGFGGGGGGAGGRSFANEEYINNYVVYPGQNSEHGKAIFKLINRN